MDGKLRQLHLFTSRQDLDPGAVLQPVVALDDHDIAVLEAVDDLDEIRVLKAEPDLSAAGRSALGEEDVFIVDDGFLGQGQDVLPRADIQDDLAERPGPEDRTRIVTSDFDPELLRIARPPSGRRG